MRSVVESIERVIVARRETIHMVVVALLTGGHILLEDVPGTGKTSLVKTLARSVDCSFHRIQFTPDLLPSDVTGVSIYKPDKGAFEWTPGPILSQFVLADEINRASPKTQAALLEAMEERQVTVDGQTHPLPEPFIVLATQNPVDQEGTFPLPEAQLDRFMLRLRLGYLDKEAEVGLLGQRLVGNALGQIKPTITAAQVLAARQKVQLVHVHPQLREYIVDLVQATRRHPLVELGASFRGVLSLAQAAQAYAYLEGRDYAVPDDVQLLATPVLAHRLVLKPEAVLRGHAGDDLLQEILQAAPVPARFAKTS